MYRNEIEGFIDSHRGEMAENICILCRTNSEEIPYVEGKPYEEGSFQALQAALGMVEGYGFSIRNCDNYVGTAGLNDKERQLDILTHLDVVPADEGWTETKPFEPVVENGKLLGCGATGDRGPAVVAPYAVRAVKELGIPLNKNVRLVLGTDEECGSSGIADHCDKGSGAPVTSSPDVKFPVINVEKGRLEGRFHVSFQASEVMPRLVKVEVRMKANVVPGKARVVVEGIDPKILEAVAEAAEKEIGVSSVLEGGLPVTTATAQGEDACAFTPQKEKNALTGLLVYLTRLSLIECPRIGMVENLLRLFPHGNICGRAAGISMEDELSDALTFALNMPAAGADGLESVSDSRCPICAAEGSVLGVVKQAVADQGLTLENDSVIPLHHVDRNSYLVGMLLSAYEDYIGFEGSCQATGGGTYVYSLRNGAAYGTALPGTDNCMHGADEFVVVDELALNAKIFAQVIVELYG